MRVNSGLLYAACFCCYIQHIVINITDAIALGAVFSVTSTPVAQTRSLAVVCGLVVGLSPGDANLNRGIYATPLGAQRGVRK